MATASQIPIAILGFVIREMQVQSRFCAPPLIVIE
jgi:hypothetical protein